MAEPAGGHLPQNGVAKPVTRNRVWFDDVVVATSYIGPIRGD